MDSKKTRTYTSLVRQKQAEDTRDRIADAAESLIKENGYERTTIGAIAKRSGVATQTVYAIFSSKQGILMYILKRAMDAVRDLCPERHVFDRDINDPASREAVSRKIARAARYKIEEEKAILNSLGGFEILYPELSALVTEEGNRRRQLVEEKTREYKNHPNALLRDEKNFTKRMELLWAITDGAFYHMLVQQCKWNVETYEKVLAQMLLFMSNDLVFE